MRRVTAVGIWGLCVVGLAPGSSLHAQRRPVQVALVTPIQVFPETDATAGLRLSLINGSTPR